MPHHALASPAEKALYRRSPPLGKRGVCADTALRLSGYFGLSDRFWFNLQARYDIEVEKDRLSGRLDAEVTPLHTLHVAPSRP